MTKFTKVFLAAATLALLAGPAQAYEKGDMLLRVGAGNVDPKSDNSAIADVDSGASLVFNGTYFFSPNLAIEVLAAAPFSHDIKLDADGSKVGETKHLPPTVSLQYHFLSDSGFRPYLGAGLNYTLFFDEETTGALTGTDLDLDASFGLAAQVGADFDVSDRMFLNLDVRWIDINTDASIDGGTPFEVEVDPIVYSLTLGWKF